MTMATTTDETIHTLNICQETIIAAPIDIAFDALLAEIGAESTMPDGTAFPFKLELWPGGRWFRDLGNNAGHLWGHVQVIKPPKLLEICGPMFMSFPATNFVQWRLTPEGEGTRLKITHRALGLIPPDVLENASMGWEYGFRQVREIAARLMKERRRDEAIVNMPRTT
jgi:uncharacterized protein YndB with AHSA1/START domain